MRSRARLDAAARTGSGEDAVRLIQDVCVGGRQRGAAGKGSGLIGATAGEPALSRDRGRDQVAVLLDAQDLPAGLAYKGCAAVDPDHPVILGQLGDANALLVGQRQCLHSVLLSLIQQCAALWERASRQPPQTAHNAARWRAGAGLTSRCTPRGVSGGFDSPWLGYK